jgi:hemerythrin
MLVWTPEYQTGSTLLDEQHKLLFEKLNKFEHLLQAPSLSKPEIDLLITFLEAYAASHFNFEEQCMFQHHCPALECNRAEHARFLEAMHHYKTEYLAKGPDREFLQGVLSYMNSWVSSHVLKIDIQLKACIKK